MKPTWIIHNIIDNPLSYHTHGLSANGSLEIEIVLPLKSEDGAFYCNMIGEAIRKGLKIEDGLMVDSIFRTPVYFFKTMPLHGDEEVFRVVFPDENNLFPWDIKNGLRCDEPYDKQISFDKDKVFMVEISACEAVENNKKDLFSLFDGFEKRDGVYTIPAQYLVVGEKETDLIRSAPYCNVHGLEKYIHHLTWFSGIDRSAIRVVCKDVDLKDPIHKSFLEWKKEFW